MLPLEGIKIVDLTRVLSGPYCTMILADFGAEVIKIETPKTGDDSRAFGPYVNGESAYYMSINRNKKSISVNTRTPEGCDLVREMIAKADVVVENFKPGTMEKLGMGYEDLKKINPEIIYVACSGFGHTGPYSKRPAYDAIVQAMGGIMSITGAGPGQYTRVGASIGDITAGLFSAIGALIAIVEKQKTGKGQKVDVAMLDCQVAILENAIARYCVSGEIPQPKGNRHPSVTPFEDFECSNGEKVMISVGNNGLWEKFLKTAGRMELFEDPRFATNPLRTANYAELKPIMDEIMKSRTSDEWYEQLVAANVPVTFVNTIDKVVNNEQILARDMIIEANHPKVGPFKMANTPIKMLHSQGGLRTPAPTVGENTDEVLREFLGKNEDEIAVILASGILE